MSVLRSSQVRALLATVVLVAAYAVLVLTHRGDYWPFSVFPMYSRGMTEWSRPVLLTVPDQADVWTSVTLEDLPGEVLSMFVSGIQRLELRAVFDRTEAWDAAGIRALRPLIGEENIDGKRVLIVDVRGTLEPGVGIDIIGVPLAVFTSDSTSLNPQYVAPSP